jgi:hypothetical protein
VFVALGKAEDGHTEETTMRFLIMHKMTEEMESGTPDPEVIAAVGALVGEAVKDGKFLGGEGLKPTSQRTHIKYQNGHRTLTDGPFAEAKELVGGFALLRVRSKEEAISWCDKFAAAIGDVELFLGPVVEPWDLGMVPKPKNPPLRYLSMHRLNEAAENVAPDPALFEKVGALIEEMRNAGVLQATEGLSSTKDGARIHFNGKKRTLIDGPFAESKELVAGYALLDLPSKQAAIEWATRFGELVRVHEVEIRPIPEW